MLFHSTIYPGHTLIEIPTRLQQSRRNFYKKPYDVKVDNSEEVIGALFNSDDGITLPQHTCSAETYSEPTDLNVYTIACNERFSKKAEITLEEHITSMVDKNPLLKPTRMKLTGTSVGDALAYGEDESDDENGGDDEENDAGEQYEAGDDGANTLKRKRPPCK